MISTFQLKLFVVLGSIGHGFGTTTGLYTVQNVATGKNVVVNQEGLPLFVPYDKFHFDEAIGREFSIWRIQNHGYNHETNGHVVTFQNSVVKDYVAVYRETKNETLLVADKKATTFEAVNLGLGKNGEEWVLKLPKSKDIWTVKGSYGQVHLEQVKGDINIKNVDAHQRFRLNWVKA